MALIKWSPFFSSKGGFAYGDEPFESMDKFLEEFQSMNPHSLSSIVPPVDMYETKDAVVVETPMAGVDPDKIEIAIDNGILSIKGATERKTEVDEKNYYRKEVRHGSLFRQVALPTRVIGDKAQAAFENGILKITVPKALEEPSPIKITVTKKEQP